MRSPHTQLVIDTIVSRACVHGVDSLSEEKLRTEVTKIIDGFREYAEDRAIHNLRRREKK